MGFFKKLFSIFKKKKDDVLEKEETSNSQIEEIKKTPEREPEPEPKPEPKPEPEPERPA